VPITLALPRRSHTAARVLADHLETLAVAEQGGWDLQRDAFFAGYAGYGFAIGTSERLARQPPSGLSAWMQHLREAIAQRMRARLPGTDGAVAATLMTGVPSAIPEADREAFRASGLAHLLAVAGLHIGAVMGLAFALARALLALSPPSSR
jgi:competence protein ComEC